MKPWLDMTMLILLVAVGSVGRAEEQKARVTLIGHKGWVYSLAFTADGKTLASASPYDGVKLWDVTTGKELPDERWHAQELRLQVKLWDVTTGKELRSLEALGPVALTGNGKFLATWWDNKIMVWEGATGKRRATLTRKETNALEGLAAGEQCLVFTADGKTLASGHADQVIHLWDVAAGKEKTALRHRGALFALAFRPDGKGLASAAANPAKLTEEYELKLWDTTTGKETIKLVSPAPAICLAFTPDGKTLAAGCIDGAVRLWDAATGKEQACLKGHAGYVDCIAFAPDGKTLVSVGDRTVMGWDVSSQKERAVLLLDVTPDHVESIGLAPDGRTLAVGDDFGGVRLWDLSKLFGRKPSK